MLAAAAFIVRHDLRFMLRQRETLLWVFVMPLVFFYFIGTVTGGFAASGDDRPDPIVLRAPADGGIVVDQIVRRLEEQDFEVVRETAPGQFERFGRRLTIPEGATASVLAGKPIEVTLEQGGDPLGSSFDQVRVNRAVYAVVADLAVIKRHARAVDEPAFAEIASAPRVLTLMVRSAGRRLQVPSGFAQAVPGTLVMFTMIVLLTGSATTLVVEREQGLLRRLASTPLSRGAIVLGKWASRMTLGVVQIGFAMIAGTVLFRVDWGAAVPMVAVLLLAWAAFTASLALLLANLVRSPGQASGIGVLTSMVLAALGGCWWPIEITPRWMQTFALFLPSGWTMDAMHKLVNFGYGPASALPHVAALGVAAIVAGAAAAKVFRYQ
jgi:ABC-type multidrug transport system permease subunit